MAQYADALKGVFVEAGWHVDVKQTAFDKPPAEFEVSPQGAFPAPENAAEAYRAPAAQALHVSQQLDARLTGGQAQLIVGTDAVRRSPLHAKHLFFSCDSRE